MTCDLICNRSTEQYPLNGKNRLHILNNREAYYYYYYYYLMGKPRVWIGRRRGIVSSSNTVVPFLYKDNWILLHIFYTNTTSASCLTHLPVRDFLQHFRVSSPQSTPWRMHLLNSENKQSINKIITSNHSLRCFPPTIYSSTTPFGGNGEPVVAVSTSHPTYKTSTNPSPSWKYFQMWLYHSSSPHN